MLTTVDKYYVVHAFLSRMNAGKLIMIKNVLILPLNINHMEDVSIPFFVTFQCYRARRKIQVACSTQLAADSFNGRPNSVLSSVVSNAG